MKITWKQIKYGLLSLLVLLGGTSLAMLLAEEGNNIPAGSLIKVSSSANIYYVGMDGRKYPFPNEITYFSWYHNFERVQTVEQVLLDSLESGPNLTIRPGIRFIKFTDSARVYAVEPGAVLRWIPNEIMFHRLGYSFQHLIELPPSLRSDYVMGDELTGPANNSVIRQGEFGSLFFVKNGQLHATTIRGMERNRFFPHHIRTTDISLTENLVRGQVITVFDPAIHLRPDERWNPIDPNEGPLEPGSVVYNPDEPQPDEETSDGLNPPTSFNAQGGNGYVSLTWQRSSSANIVSYLIYRSRESITTPSSDLLITTVSADTVIYLDTSSTIRELTTYHYAIRAINTDGVYSNLVQDYTTTLAGTPDPNQPSTPTPNAPSNFSASASEQGINLTWTAPSNATVINYQVFRALSNITNVEGSGVVLVATINAPTTQYLNTNLNPETTYHYAVRAIGLGGIGAHANVSATTPPPPLDRVLHLPEPPDNVVNADGLTWSKNTATMAASLGINKLMVPTRYYQGVNDLDPSYGSQACINHVGRFCGPYHDFLTHVDGLSTPDGRPVEVIFLSAKVTKTPMTADPQLKGAIRLQQMGAEPYDFFERLSQTSGTLPPGGQGENRAFIAVNFTDPAERDRLLRLTTNISGDSVRVRWFPTVWGEAKFIDSGIGQLGLGTKTWDMPNPTVGANNQYLLMIQNTGTGNLSWEITGLTEVAPAPSTIRNQDANYFEWLGNTAGFTTYGYNHPRYALNETRTRFINTMSIVWNEFSNHPSLIGLMGYGDEPHAMFWMDEDTANFQNAGHQLAEFEKAVAAGQYAFTQNNFMLFGDPRDPTHNGISTGVYASNMAGGGFSNMASYFSGAEPIDWVIWAGAHSTSQISGFTSQGFGVYLMQALYESNYASEFGRWVTAANGLSSSEKDRIKGWFYYAEQRYSVTQEILQSAINATPSQL